MNARHIVEGKTVHGYRLFLLVTTVLFICSCSSEMNQEPLERMSVEDGVMVWESGEEASLFGVNYSPAFAHSYRALNRVGKDHKEAIEEDAYHFSRLGLDAYRIHMWDTEVSDSLGNLLNTEHLDLHDYTLYQMKQRGIRAIMTPLTFYNNAYPDGATETEGFANYISKGQAPQNRDYWPVLENYLEELITHVNPYTRMTAIEDPNIIAIEIVNEPSHGSDHARTTEYINELVQHMRENGWDKPIFYNISQSPGAAPGVMDADIQGVTFQWYPAGLVGGEQIEKNYLPYVNRYPVPWDDDERFRSKAMMVYEFDPADVGNAYALPLMARSFRAAGFQWATQFAYDPMAFAHINSDYQTHYVNLAYTPSKAISMKIASEVFDRVPRRQQFNALQADTVFGDFRVSHAQNLSEMNTEEAFIYSNSTETTPRDVDALEHISGVGSSPVIRYNGLGAYFLDKLEDGTWRLEVMPDAISVSDPFERPNFDKSVTLIEWNERTMQINLNDLGSSYEVRGVNDGNNFRTGASDGTIIITPGVYVLSRDEETGSDWTGDSWMGSIRIGEFAAPETNLDRPVVRHEPFEKVSAGQPVTISATVAGVRPDHRVWLQVNPVAAQNSRIEMQEVRPYTYEAEIPGEIISTGGFSYWIVLEQDDEMVAFPGNHAGAPWQWNYYYDDNWFTDVIDEGTSIEIFNAASDFLRTEQGFGGGNQSSQLLPVGLQGNIGWQVSSTQPTAHRHVLGWSSTIRDHLKGISESTLNSYQSLVIRAKTDFQLPSDLKVVVVDNRGNSYSALVPVTNIYQEYRIPFSSFEPDAFMLLPRSYPPFMESWYESGSEDPFLTQNLEEIQFLVDTRSITAEISDRYGFEIESAWLTTDE